MLFAYTVTREADVVLLQVRDFPPELYEELGRLAKQERRSIAQQTVTILSDALGKPETAKERRRRVLAEACERAELLPVTTLDPVAIVREDRER